MHLAAVPVHLMVHHIRGVFPRRGRPLVVRVAPDALVHLGLARAEHVVLRRLPRLQLPLLVGLALQARGLLGLSRLKLLLRRVPLFVGLALQTRGLLARLLRGLDLRCIGLDLRCGERAPPDQFHGRIGGVVRGGGGVLRECPDLLKLVPQEGTERFKLCAWRGVRLPRSRGEHLLQGA